MSLEKHRHITKAQFDREFEIYHQLSKSFFSMIVSLSSFTNRTLELNECPQDNRKIIVDNITRMIDKTGMAQNVLYENSAFIPKDIFELYDAIYENANDLFWCYEKKSLDYASGRIDIANLISEDNKVTAKEIEHNFYIASAKLREYLGTLAIVE